MVKTSTMVAGQGSASTYTVPKPKKNGDNKSGGYFAYDQRWFKSLAPFIKCYIEEISGSYQGASPSYLTPSPWVSKALDSSSSTFPSRSMSQQATYFFYGHR